eukprot:3806477-Pleurochrysis_carterae.AAC.5
MTWSFLKPATSESTRSSEQKRSERAWDALQSQRARIAGWATVSENNELAKGRSAPKDGKRFAIPQLNQNQRALKGSKRSY